MTENHLYDLGRNVRKQLPEIDAYISLAEEAAELAQAATKMARYLSGKNPTDKTLTEINDNLVEEFTDLMTVAKYVIGLETDPGMASFKMQRWISRLKQA